MSEVELLSAVSEVNLARVNELLASGADPNAKDKKGLTPLHCVILKAVFEVATQTRPVIDSHKKIVEALLAKGANPNAQNNDGVTPLDYAASYGLKDIAELLIAKGGDPNAKDASYGLTPLHSSVVGGHKEVTQFLLDKGANPNAKAKDGRTPLLTALAYSPAAGNIKEIVEVLLANKANPNAQDNHGQTALHLNLINSSISNPKEIVNLLLAKGADPNVKNMRGDTPLHCALGSLEPIHGCKEIVKQLIARDADLNIRNNNGKLAFDMTADVRIKDMLIGSGCYVRGEREPTEKEKARWTGSQEQSYLKARYSGGRDPEGKASIPDR